MNIRNPKPKNLPGDVLSHTAQFLSRLDRSALATVSKDYANACKKISACHFKLRELLDLLVRDQFISAMQAEKIKSSSQETKVTYSQLLKEHRNHIKKAIDIRLDKMKFEKYLKCISKAEHLSNQEIQDIRLSIANGQFNKRRMKKYMWDINSRP